MDFCLHEKYRPVDFKSFYGHSLIKSLFSMFLKNDFIPNSIILYGPVGTGKTSLARILFKTFNCHCSFKKRKKIGYLSVCNNCYSCVNNIRDNNTDYVEIDAASNRKVDVLCDIVNNFYYYPIYGKYKFFCIDEAHMLSKHSFNFLLKKIETLPKHVVFLFLTTEIHNLPDSIISRSFVFNIRRFSSTDVFKFIRKVSALENIKISLNSLYLISSFSKGSLRDSLIILEHSSLLGCGVVSSKIVYMVTGSINPKFIFFFIKLICENNKPLVFNFIYLLNKYSIGYCDFIIGVFNFINEFILFSYTKSTFSSIRLYSFKYKYNMFSYFLENGFILLLKSINKVLRNEISFISGFENSDSSYIYIVNLIFDVLSGAGLEPASLCGKF